MNDRHAFVVDVNKCTGCHACEMACQIANHLPGDRRWREVRTFNELHVPGVEMVHLSLACNHCREAPCLEQCPALAYSRDEQTGAVLIDAEACIGCRYCAWVCPYDAPRFDADRGVMTKCTMCHEKLLAGGRPACVTSCPTGALEWSVLPDVELTQDVPGFVQAGTDPGIRVVGVRPERRVPAMTTAPALPPWWRLRQAITPQITLSHEWPLAVFTLLAAILVGALAASQWGGRALVWWLFLGGGLAGMGLSASHLGHRERAWRAPLHFARSRLSREVLLFSAFLGLATVVLAWSASSFEPVLPSWVGRLVAGLGMLVLLAVDRVYGAARIRGAGVLHSAHVLGTGVLLAAVWTRADLVVVTVAVLKLALYVARQFGRMHREMAAPLGLTVPRLGFLIAGAGWLWWSTDVAVSLPATAMLMAGELIDRGLYYHELEIPTPTSRMFDELETRPAAHGVFAEQ